MLHRYTPAAAECRGSHDLIYNILTVEGVLALKDFIIYRVRVTTVKRRISAEENVEDDTTGPYVTFLIILTFDDLWSHVVRLKYYNQGWDEAINNKIVNRRLNNDGS